MMCGKVTVTLFESHTHSVGRITLEQVARNRRDRTVFKGCNVILLIEGLYTKRCRKVNHSQSHNFLSLYVFQYMTSKKLSDASCRT